MNICSTQKYGNKSQKWQYSTSFPDTRVFFYTNSIYS